MKALPPDILHFFHKQNFVIVSTIDEGGMPHSSCKGIIEINPDGKVYLLDLYTGKTQNNLKKNPLIGITAIDEHRFIGYCLKGRARILQESEVNDDIVKLWKDKIAARVTHRILKKMHGEKGHPMHPEILMPHPKYMIVAEIEDIIDLTPGHLK